MKLTRAREIGIAMMPCYEKRGEVISPLARHCLFISRRLIATSLRHREHDACCLAARDHCMFIFSAITSPFLATSIIFRIEICSSHLGSGILDIMMHK